MVAFLQRLIAMTKRRPFEEQLMLYTLIPSALLLIVAIALMFAAEVSYWLIAIFALAGTLLVAYFCYISHQKTAYQFRSLSNILEALINGDYSLRARSDVHEGALEDLVDSINGLAQRLSAQRSESVESQLLLRTVIDHIDVAIIALDEENNIQFANPAARNLLALDKLNVQEQLLEQFSFVKSFKSGHNQVVELTLGHQKGRFNIHVEEFREAGIQNKLLFITDVRTLLRSEERKAWQSLVRVISHEINNSLSPIASISETLSKLLERQDDIRVIHGDLREGLGLISERAKGLGQFIESYKQLARLPEPKKQHISTLSLFDNIRVLFKHCTIDIQSETEHSIHVDPVQFEQVLINLVKNAVESMALVNPSGAIAVEWEVDDLFFKLKILDEGLGINNPDNLFVPFYSTKKQGTGIGLVLCRQIVEAHNGRLSLNNREDMRGCCASIELPRDE